VPKTAEQYAGRFFEEWFGHAPAGAHQRALCASLAEHFATALADARALPGAMAPPDLDGARRWARGALSPEGKARVIALCDWSDYLASWVHDLLTDRGAYDARREGEAAGLRRAADYLLARGYTVGVDVRRMADFTDAGPPPPPVRLQADLAACRAALAGLLRVLEAGGGPDPMDVNRALAEAHLTLRGQPT
jgi:hypothetical protein